MARHNLKIIYLKILARIKINNNHKIISLCHDEYKISSYSIIITVQLKPLQLNYNLLRKTSLLSFEK